MNYLGEERNDDIREEDLNKIKEFVKSITYGSVTIIVQDGRIIQLEKHEKLRLK